MTSELLQKLGVTERDLIWAVVSAIFFSDFAVVKSVSSDKKRVDVEHAIQPVIAGQQQDARSTVNVEILWPASAELSMRWDIAAGDTVLLVGLKDYVKDVDGNLPGKTKVGLHYTQETMKAIPLGAYSASSTHTIEATGSKLKLDGGGKAAARQDDATTANAVTDATFWVWIAAVSTFCGGLTPPTSLTGKVNAGSAKVEIG